MFLKFRYRLGYESLCAEVRDSVSWRRFCRIPLGGRVPHPTTLMKLTTRCGAGAVTGLNEALLAWAARQELLRTTRVRADTTVIPANVAYPTDSGLLARAVGKLVRTARRVQAAGGATGTVMTGRRLAAARRVLEIASRLRSRGKLSREEGTRAIRRATRELAGLAEQAAEQATAVLRNGRRALGRALTGRTRGRLRRALDELAVTIERTTTIIAQARSRLAGQMPDGATRLVSLHDPDARPIRKGRIDRPVELGYKAQVTDNDDGIVLDYAVEHGAAPDGPQLVPAITRVARRAGQVPRAVTADRGYGQPAVERGLHDLGVTTVAIPRQATTSPARKATEHARDFRALVKWRTGCEGRTSHLKHGYGWDRTLLDGKTGATIWCGLAVFAHNLVKISTLASQPHEDTRNTANNQPNSAPRLFQVEVARPKRRPRAFQRAERSL
jgi:transposase, IS5 family